MSPSSRRSTRIAIYISIPFIGLVSFWWGVTCPVRTLPRHPLVLASAVELRKHVSRLTDLPKARQTENPEALAAAARYIRTTWERLGLHVESQPYHVGKQGFRNLMVSFGPEDAERIVIGAHYDVCGEQPGADDNASGIAGLLELARLLKEQSPHLRRRIDLVAYSTEEPPYFGTHDMGSWVHAKSLKDQGVKVAAMFSLEMIGFFSNKSGSQRFPIPLFRLFYPSRGDFIALVGRFTDHGLAGRMKALMQSRCTLGVYSVSAPTFVTGVDWSDQRNYWELGYPALMVTDTSFLRNPNYHKPTDKISTLDFARMAQVVDGVYGAVIAL